MARIAKGRDRVLTRAEIATETLHQFDKRAEAPSIRALAFALGVAPSAIYHHYESQAAIVQAATELVWEEVGRELLAAIPEPLDADPVDVLVTAGVVTRRVFDRHYRIAPFIAAAPEANDFMNEVLAVLGLAFERLRLNRDEAAVSFYAYSSFVIGTVLFSATRRIANDDPPLGEELFAAGLRRLVQSFVAERR